MGAVAAMMVGLTTAGAISLPTGAAWAQSRQQADDRAARLDALFDELKDPKNTAWKETEREIWTLWSQSGSGSMDLLLRRGRAAMQAGHLTIAVNHFSALIDHAPDFAEGWNARATAYFMQGEFGLSIGDIEQVLARNPRHFGALSGLGAIMEQIDQPERALKAYRASLAIHPHQPDVEDAVRRLDEQTHGTSL